MYHIFLEKVNDPKKDKRQCKYKTRIGNVQKRRKKKPMGRKGKKSENRWRNE
jgi:hypothetical protein